MQRFDSIEALRGFAAWWVVFGHALQLTGPITWIPWKVRWLLGHADLAVELFMIVSGFVIAHLIINKQEAYAPYISRRYLRLAPLFLLMTGIAILSWPLYEVAFTNPHAFDPAMRLARHAEETSNWPVHLLLHLTMMHGAIPDSVLPFASSTFLAPAWSISLEMQFYLLAPFLLTANGTKRAIGVMVALVAGMVAAQAGVLGHWRYESFLPAALPFFLVGISTRLAIGGQLDRATAYLTAISLILFALFIPNFDRALGLLIVFGIWTVFAYLALRESRGLAPPKALRPIVFNRAVQRLGEASYSTYLVHIPLFSIILGAALSITGRTDQAFIVAVLAACIPLTALASLALFSTVERQGNILGKAIAAKLTERSTAADAML